MLEINVALRAPVSPRITVVSPERAAASQRGQFLGATGLSSRHSWLRGYVVGSAASEVMMLGSGEFVMLLLRCCLLLML